MNIEQTAAILAKIASLDGRNDTDAAILGWHEAIGDLDYRDCLEAAAIHRRESDEYLMPVHIRRIVSRLRAERGQVEAREQRQRELDAYATQAGPLTDRSAEIQDFVDDVREALPEGNVRSLFPRREAWKREQHARQRPDAEPNPLWDPTMGPASAWQRSTGPLRGAWWEDEAQREADSRKILHLAGRLKGRRGGQTEEAS